MTKEEITAEALHGYKFFRHPKNATLGVLRLDTENEHYWVLVTRKSLRMLSDELAKHVDDLEPMQ